jgi:nitric oxide dioxygenase
VTKHCGLQVLPEHYSIVHDNLMIAVGEVLGAAVTPEIATAWSDAVNFLAKVLIGAEEAKYVAAESRSGGWRGWKDFKVAAIEPAGSAAKCFTFVPADGSLPAAGFAFTPGQYLSIQLPENTPRHYTVTSKPGDAYLQCTTKRVSGGAVSGYMHETLKVGDVVRLSPPFGPFCVAPDSSSAVLLSAGIGQTPMKAFLDSHGALVVRAVHVDKDAAAVPYYQHFETHNAGKNQWLFSAQGRPDMAAVTAALVKEAGANHRFYVCGPTSFMKDAVHGLIAAGVPRASIVWEAFAPQLSCPV